MKIQRKYYSNPAKKKNKDMPEELLIKINNSRVPLVRKQTEPIPEIKKETRGRKPGGNITQAHKQAIGAANKERFKRDREGLGRWAKHGAYTFMKKGSIPEKKKNLLHSVAKERRKWILQLGGEPCLSFIEKSLIDQACRILLYCIMIDEFLISDNESSVVYTDDETKEVKIHSALNRHYLSFSKLYCSILKELNKISASGKNKKGGMGSLDAAKKMQMLLKKG